MFVEEPRDSVLEAMNSAKKRRSRKDRYARLTSYLADCLTQSRISINYMLDEEYLPKAYKDEYRRKMRRVEEKLDRLTGTVVRWKDAIRNVDIEYVIQLNSIYQAMMSEFEFFEVRPPVIAELEKEIALMSKIKKMNPEKCVYEKTLNDYCESITSLAEKLYNSKIIKRARKRKYGQFDIKAFNAEMKELYNEEGIASNEVFNSYKLDSLTSRRSFSYIKNLIAYAILYSDKGDEEDAWIDDDLYLMSYTTPLAMVSFKINLKTFEIFSEIRYYDAAETFGYREVILPIEMQTDMYKIFESFNFSIRQRKDASLKYQRVIETIEKYEEE